MHGRKKCVVIILKKPQLKMLGFCLFEKELKTLLYVSGSEPHACISIVFLFYWRTYHPATDAEGRNRTARLRAGTGEILYRPTRKDQWASNGHLPLRCVEHMKLA